MNLKTRSQVIIGLLFMVFLLLSFNRNDWEGISPKESAALIVIDMQQGFFSNPKYQVYNESTLISNVNELIEVFREHELPIIFVRHNDEDLVRDTKPWEVLSGVDSRKDDIYVDKTTPDSFYKTNLLNVLKKKNIDSIIIVGLQTDLCIDSTCKSAFGKEISTILVSDGHSTYDNSFMKAEKIIEYHNKIIGQ